MSQTWKRRLAIEFLLFVIPPMVLGCVMLAYQLYYDVYISAERQRLDNRILDIRQTMILKIDSVRQADFIEATKSSELKSLFPHKEYHAYTLTNIHDDTIPTHYLFYRKELIVKEIDALEAGIIGVNAIAGKYIPRRDVYRYIKEDDPESYLWEPKTLEAGLGIYFILLIVIYPIRILIIIGTIWSIKNIKSKHV